MNNERFKIPGIKGKLIAYYVNGDSMKPSINNGDMVLCKEIDISEDLSLSKIYSIQTNSCVWVKRLEKVYDRNNIWSHLRLISDNKNEYSPFLIEVSAIKSIQEVTRKITNVS